MKKSLMNKSTLKILSLLIAILIWIVVKNVQDPMSVSYTHLTLPTNSLV